MDERRNTMNITHEERLKLLKAHNDLMNILQTIYDCQDMFISDVGKLERIQSELSNIFKFVRGENYYSDWVFANSTVDPDGEQPDV
jgi:SepF-like predicted cell division protein (DUF552 family)